MTSPILSAIEQICQEKKIKPEQVLVAIEQSLAAAYRREFHAKNQNIKAQFNPATQEIRVFDVKIVVEDMELELEESKIVKSAKKPKKVEMPEGKKEELLEGDETGPKFNSKTQIMLSEAKKIKKDIKIGDEIKTELPVPTNFGRVAAQTAKQVIIQKLREVERQTIYDFYKQQEGQVVQGIVQRWERGLILIDLTNVVAILPPSEQVEGEEYRPGLKLKFLILSVNQTTKGPEIVLSRLAPEIVVEIFKQEIPEITNGVVEIKKIVREAGYRTKVAVHTEEKSVDPIGSCIGQRGVRIQTIINALGGEKVDIIEYSTNPSRFIVNALAPAKVTEISLNEKEKEALAIIKPNQLSLAIGRAGMNIRLASRLTGWKINVRSEETKEEKKEEVKEENKKEAEK